MMENVISTMQRRRILFLISLPQTPEFEKDREDIKECLNELRELQVDVREHIERNDLADANCYDVVIVVTHHDSDNDALILANGTMKMTEFVNSLPSDFKGVLDFSSCYSASAFRAIKKRCPHCLVQAALVEVRLLQRIIMYPSLVELLNEDLSIDYHEAYKEVSKAFDTYVESNDKGQDNPKMAQLGQQMSSIYSPSEVKRDCPFQIIVFLHYDEEKEIVKIKAQRWQTNTIIRDDFEIPIAMKEGEKIAVTLSFDSSDNTNIIANDGEYKKYLTIKKEMVIERFKVTVLSGFKGNGFLANLELSKDDVSFVRCAFNIDVTDHENKAPADIVMEIPQQPEKPEDIIKCYADIFTARIFDYDSNTGNYSNFQQTLSKKNTDSDKLHFIRRFIYNNDLFLNQLKKFVDSNSNELSNLLKEDSKDKTIITWDIVPLLKGCIIKIQERIDSLETKFKSVKIKARGTLNFDEALPKIPSLESKFIDLSSDIKYTDYQIQMLKIYKELRDNLNKYSKEDIKESASDFWEYPHKHLVDQGLFDILRNKCNPGSIKSSKSGGNKGVSMSYLALLLAMVCGEYVSIDNGKEGWYINVADYIDLSKYKEESLRTPKSRINDFVSVLRDKGVRESISDYMKTKVGKMSISAVLLLKMKV